MRNQGHALRLFEDTASPFAVLILLDGEERAKHDFGEPKPAFLLSDHAFREYLQAGEEELGELGDGAKSGEVAGGHRAEQQVLRGPEAGFAAKFRKLNWSSVAVSS